MQKNKWINAKNANWIIKPFKAPPACTLFHYNKILNAAGEIFYFHKNEHFVVRKTAKIVQIFGLIGKPGPKRGYSVQFYQKKKTNNPQVTKKHKKNRKMAKKTILFYKIKKGKTQKKIWCLCSPPAKDLQIHHVYVTSR